MNLWNSDPDSTNRTALALPRADVNLQQKSLRGISYSSRILSSSGKIDSSTPTPHALSSPKNLHVRVSSGPTPMPVGSFFGRAPAQRPSVVPLCPASEHPLWVGGEVYASSCWLTFRCSRRVSWVPPLSGLGFYLCLRAPPVSFRFLSIVLSGLLFL